MPFVKGDPRINREGRPEGSISVVSALKRELAKCPDGEKKSYLELLVKRILKKGIVDGDASIIKDIINRVDGLPQQNLDLTTLGQKITPIFNGQSIPKHEGNSKDIQPDKED